MEQPSAFIRTPTWTIIVTEVAVGLVLVVFAIFNIAGTTEGLIAVGLGTGGGMALGLALGMTRHRLDARDAVDRTL